MRTFITLVLVTLMLPGAVMAAELEVAHWWTSVGEARAVSFIKEAFEKNGHKWKDVSIKGGGGDQLIARLKAMTAAGRPPAAVQVFMGPNLKDYAKEGFLVDLTETAREGGWEKVLPPLINDLIQSDGRYVGAPINAHRVNSMWLNSAILTKVGATVPNTWGEFLVEAEKIKNAGYIPLALGGQAWQEATLFENIALGVGGAEFHRKAFVELDRETLASPTMVKSFEMLRRVLEYIDPDFTGRNWDDATKMVMEGRAAMQIMGDWAKGEFLSKQLVPVKDFICKPAPGTDGLFLIDTDTIAMFKHSDPEILEAQMALARVIMEPDVQKKFNIIKGSVPARLGVDCQDFDPCACASMNAFAKAAESGAVIPSMAYSQAYDREVTSLMTELVGTFVHSEMTAREAAEKMAAIALLNM